MSGDEAARLGKCVEGFLSAIRHRRTTRAARLLRRYPQITRADIYAACAAGDAEAAPALLDEDAALRSAPHAAGEGFTPLLYACASPLHAESPARAQGIVRCAKLLLDRGASPNEHMLYDNDPKSPIAALYFACVANNVELVKLLLERDADPNDGESIYHSAELDHRECLELLLAHGADLGGRHSHWGNTPLYFLAGYREGNPAAPKAYAGMRWLLEHGADPNVTSTEREETPLHQVARNTQTAAVAEMLLAHGASVDPQNTEGRTPFVLATRAGKVAVAQLLRERGADVTRLTPADEFLGACLTADEPKARALAAADPSLVARLAEADLHGLLHAGANAKSEAALRLMHALGFDLRSESQWGGTPLHWSAWQGDIGLVKLLLSLDPPVNMRDKQFGSSPLGWAAHGSANCRRADDDYEAVIELLIDAGANRESTINRWGGTPEALSSRRVARLLRRRGFAPA